MRTVLLKALACAAGAVILSLALHAAYDFGDVEQVREKHRQFRRRAQDYDVVFVGSSLTVSHVSPGEFTRVAARHGIAARAFNFGISDMVPPETFFTVRRILSYRPASLRCMVIEVAPFRLDVPDAALRMPKWVYWHDAATLRELLAVLRTRGVSPATRARQAWRHAVLFLRNSLNCGRGLELFLPDREPESARRENLGFSGDGYVSYEDYVRMGRTDVAELMRRFGERREGFTARIRALREGRAEGWCALTEEERRRYARLAGDLRRRGVEPVFVVMPRPEDQRALLDLRTCDGGVTVLDLADPRKWPEFYDPAIRADELHLTKDGALLLTRALADGLLPVLRKQSAPGGSAPAPSG